MKKISIIMMIIAAFCFTACNDDEPEDPTANIAGSYNGYVEASSGYFNGMYEDDQTVTLTRNADGTFNISYESESFGTFSITNATATVSGNTVTLTGAGVTEMGMNGNTKEYNCTFSGKVNADKSNPDFTFSVPTVMGGLNIHFLPGTAPETEE